MWEIEYTNEFEDWWNKLNDVEQEDVDSYVGLLTKEGPNLPFPYSSKITNSKHGHMRELRIQHKGQPHRVLYAFNPKRIVILLLGGNKIGDNRWYIKNVPLADKLYDERLDELMKEEYIND